MKKLFSYLNLSVVIILLFPLIFQCTFIDKSLNSYAQNMDQCTEKLDSAQQKYEAGHLTEAINLIESCLKIPNLSENEQARAYRLLGLIYISEKIEKEAKDTVKNPPQLEKIVDNINSTLIPRISDITPNAIDQKEKGFLMIVKGSDFADGSVVRFNRIAKPTTFISTTELWAEIPASDILNEGEYEVYVDNTAMGGKLSNAAMFKIKSSSSFPWRWIAFGGVAVAVVVGAISYFIHPTTDNTIADPPGRP